MVNLCGLYAIADTSLIPTNQLRHTALQAILGGARLIQYRDKNNDSPTRARDAAMLQNLCREHHVLFIVNDDVQLAQSVQADGVHLGRTDTGLDSARSLLGKDAIIGISCYNQWQRAITANNEGADYVAFGRFFPSQSKPDALAADPQLLQDAHSQLTIPTVAIGGITPDNGDQLIKAGANMLAVIHGLFGQPDVRVTARRYSQLFDCGQEKNDSIP